MMRQRDPPVFFSRYDRLARRRYDILFVEETVPLPPIAAQHNISTSITVLLLDTHTHHHTSHALSIGAHLMNI